MPSDHPPIRIGDAERERSAAALGRHTALGRLTITEFQDRLDVVYAARTSAELDGVLVDLPPPGPVPRPAVRPPTPAWAPWALTGTVCLVVWLATSLAQGHPLGFWPFWVIGPWGAVLLARTAQERRRPGSPPTTP